MNNKIINKITLYLNKPIFIIVIISIISFVRLLQVVYLPISANYLPNDDSLFLRIAESIRQGNWLGNYDHLILSKGPGTSIIAAFFNIIHIPFLIGELLLYILACIAFIVALNKARKNKFILLIFFCILVFSPAITSEDNFQRLYRGGLSETLCLLIISGILAICLRSKIKAKKILPWLLLIGASCGILAITRDDGIFIYPFIVVALVVLSIYEIKINKNNKFKSFPKILSYCIPIFTFILIVGTISCINYSYYNFFGYVDTKNTNFEKTIKTMYSIKEDNEYTHVSVSREKIKKMYDLSPTLSLIKNNLENELDNWSSLNQINTNKEVEDGWFYWAFREATYQSGYYTNFNTSEKFYKDINDELKTAIKENNISTIPVMPSSLMSPWKDNYWYELTNSLINANNFVFNFLNLDAKGDFIGTGSKSYADEVSSFTYNIAYTKDNQTSDNIYSINTSIRAAKITNAFNFIYKYSVKYIFIISFTITLICILFQFKKRKTYRVAPETIFLFLFIVGLLLTYLLLLIGVCYTDISAYSAINCKYFSYAYPIILSICLVSITIIYNTMQINKQIK